MSSDERHWPTLAPARVRATSTPFARISAREQTLWVLVGVALVGDLLTTYYGLQLGLTESNPVARAAIQQFGFASMVALKLFAVGVGVFCRRFLPEEYVLLVPAGLAVPWLTAVGLNLMLFPMVW